MTFDKALKVAQAWNWLNRELRHVDTHHSEPVYQVQGQSVLVQTLAKEPPVSVVGQLMIPHNAATRMQNTIAEARRAMSGRFAGARPSRHNTLVRVSLYIGHRWTDQGQEYTLRSCGHVPPDNGDCFRLGGTHGSRHRGICYNNQ